MEINPKDFEAVISEVLSDYADEVIEEVKESAKQNANECIKKIKSRCPIKSGAYKKSWKVKKTIDNAVEIEFVVHSTRYQLTHLLEYGHNIVKMKDGKYAVLGKTPARAHIRPSAEETSDNFLKSIKEIVK